MSGTDLAVHRESHLIITWTAQAPPPLKKKKHRIFIRIILRPNIKYTRLYLSADQLFVRISSTPPPSHPHKRFPRSPCAASTNCCALATFCHTGRTLFATLPCWRRSSVPATAVLKPFAEDNLSAIQVFRRSCLSMSDITHSGSLGRKVFSFPTSLP